VPRFHERRSLNYSASRQDKMTPKLAAFPKCYMDELCVHRTMTVGDWIEMGATLGVQGLEFYSGFIEDNEAFLRETKASLQKHGLQMLCCSPDFTEPDADLLAQQIKRERRMIEITAFLGGRFCRVLSGQRRPGLPDRRPNVADGCWTRSSVPLLLFQKILNIKNLL
jgi:sugar phosphate isomerase/epimerase